MKLPLSSLMQRLPNRINLFVCCASFEDRSRSIATSLDPTKVDKALICSNEDYATQSSSNRSLLMQRYSSNHELVSIRTDAPLLVADRFAESLNRLPLTSQSTILIDITTFTHEQLLILTRLIRGSPVSCNILAAYTGAAEYALGLPQDKKWLSRGVDDVRSVLGYPGNLLPSKRLHLIVLSGFESERAEKLIEAFQPAKISLGVGAQSASINDQLHATNVAFHSKVLSFANTLATVSAEVHLFEFSCVDPMAAKDMVMAQTRLFPGFNTVIAPMNTKISTLGVALAAFQDETLQVCYAHPVTYNTDKYSSAGTECRLFDLTEHFFNQPSANPLSVS